MLRIIKITSFILLNVFTIFAQNTSSETVEMADVMRSNGKIYVVVLVLGVILTGIIVYLINLDKKIAKIENRIK